jgi:flagellar biosynthetic protein FliP
MVVASTLMSKGMMMLPPAMISLPFKVLLFVLVERVAAHIRNDRQKLR